MVGANALKVLDQRVHQFAGVGRIRNDRIGRDVLLDRKRIVAGADGSIHEDEAIERTHRITGMPKAEIVRRGLVRSEIPLYGVGGALTMGALARQDEYQP